MSADEDRPVRRRPRSSRPVPRAESAPSRTAASARADARWREEVQDPVLEDRAAGSPVRGSRDPVPDLEEERFAVDLGPDAFEDPIASSATFEPVSSERSRAGRAEPAGLEPALANPIVPRQSVPGRALMLVIAIMTFLAAVTAGLVTAVWNADRSWEGGIRSELTVELKPVDGLDQTAQIAQALKVVAAEPGLGRARAIPESETRAMLAPWLGSDLDLSLLPVPRLIAVAVADPKLADLDALSRALEAVPGARLDDHRRYTSALSGVARRVTVAGIAFLVLMLGASCFSVVFATQAAMASNRGTVEVLHFIGAENRFIARQFQNRFLRIGLTGGAAGGLLALVLFALTALFGRGPDAFLGHVVIGPLGYAAVIGLVTFVTVLTATTARLSVGAQIHALD